MKPTKMNYTMLKILLKYHNKIDLYFFDLKYLLY